MQGETPRQDAGMVDGGGFHGRKDGEGGVARREFGGEDDAAGDQTGVTPPPARAGFSAAGDAERHGEVEIHVRYRGGSVPAAREGPRRTEDKKTVLQGGGGRAEIERTARGVVAPIAAAERRAAPSPGDATSQVLKDSLPVNSSCRISTRQEKTPSSPAPLLQSCKWKRTKR